MQLQPLKVSGIQRNYIASNARNSSSFSQLVTGLTAAMDIDIPSLKSFLRYFLVELYKQDGLCFSLLWW